MKILIPVLLTVLLAVPFIFSAINEKPIANLVPAAEASGPRKHLRPFASQAELKTYLKKLTKKRKEVYGADDKAVSNTYSTAAPPPATKSAGESTLAGAPAPSQSSKDESITNVQHAGVDEGGIVKSHGNHLVVLRRGRLFTIAIGDNTLKPVSAINAYGPGIDPNGTWYDEMLISGDTIIVIGYSYERGGTEVGLFQIDSGGGLRYRSTYHLRSDDYYSSRNYSSRLIDGKLVFYSPLYLEGDGDDPMRSFPALRRWHKGAKDSEFQSIAPATRVYRAGNDLNADDELALHSVTVCDLDGGEMSCKATVVIGPAGDVFYVSPKSVYVWASAWNESEENDASHSILFKMPLDGSGPSALKVSGSPVDQFSFLEDEGGDLNVLVRSDSSGDGMWAAEVSAGDVALLKVSPASFSDGSTAAPRRSYRQLTKPEGNTFQNRFIGDYLLYGTGSGWGPPERRNESTLYALNLKGGDVSQVKLSHGVDRIEALGSNAVVVGTNGNDLTFSTVRLDDRPDKVDQYTLKDASQGELRSHGFFYKPDASNSGMLGLPVSTASRPGYEHLFNGSASILFLRNDSLKLKGLGELRSRSEGTTDDGCQASCVDWYGNARPLFLQGRVFALLGYEIVEGNIRDGRIAEARRVSYAPKSLAASNR